MNIELALAEQICSALEQKNMPGSANPGKRSLFHEGWAGGHRSRLCLRRLPHHAGCLQNPEFPWLSHALPTPRPRLLITGSQPLPVPQQPQGDHHVTTRLPSAKPMLLKLDWAAPEPPQGHVRTGSGDASDPAGLGWGPSISVCRESPGDTDVAGMETTLWKPVL